MSLWKSFWDLIYQLLLKSKVEPEGEISVSHVGIMPSFYDADAEEMRYRVKIVSFMRKNLGDKYKLGIEVPVGQDSDTWDCSEIVEAAYREAGLVMPDGSPYQFDYCRPVKEPIMGDLGFLWSEKWGRIGHVMVKTEGDTLIHAVGGRGVVEDPVSMWETNPRFKGWRRHPDFARPKEDRA